MDALGKLVGEEIRAMAARRRMSISALARALDLPQTYVARRVDGRAAFTPAELARVAEVLDVPVAELLPREAHRVPPAAVAVDFSGLDLNALQKIAAALGVSVASLVPVVRESEAAGASQGAPPPHFRPEDQDPDNPNSTYFSPPAVRTPSDQPKAVTSLSDRSAESTRPPSGPRAKVADRVTGPSHRRPRVSARLAGSRS